MVPRGVPNMPHHYVGAIRGIVGEKMDLEGQNNFKICNFKAQKCSFCPEKGNFDPPKTN